MPLTQPATASNVAIAIRDVRMEPRSRRTVHDVQWSGMTGKRITREQWRAPIPMLFWRALLRSAMAEWTGSRAKPAAFASIGDRQDLPDGMRTGRIRRVGVDSRSVRDYLLA